MIMSDERSQIVEKLNKMQDKLNKEFEKKGLTDEILETQIEINKIRSEYNITDERELHEGGYLQ